MPVYLDALALQNYRGIGDAIQKMHEFRKFNFFIGANNAGKSTVLNFISKHLPLNPQFSTVLRAKTETGPLDQNIQAAGKSIYMEIGWPRHKVLDEIKRNMQKISNSELYMEFIDTIIDQMSDEHQVVWKGSRIPYEEKLKLQIMDRHSLASSLTPHQWNALWTAITERSGGGRDQHWIPETLSAIDGSITLSLPTIQIIPAIRQIGPKHAAFEDFSGSGLIDRLASIQNPEHDRRQERTKFDRINGFLRFVTGKCDAEIEIPYSRDHILVHMDSRVLPLASLGTGIHEVIMKAAFCTLSENQIICVEEPEIHLHPLLQRKLMSYLDSETQNQYFIATHSAAFIDTPGAAIFHVALEENNTRIREAVLRQDRYAICVDLGHRASDIVQANAVLWVEGPSDRIYLKHWIDIAAPDLKEGIHYSIMFYGGRLLSHLSADDEEVSDFIQLRSLNRNLAIVMDSDKSSPQTRVNDTKKRIEAEFRELGGIAWVTKGREIENYIEYGRLQRAIRNLYHGIYDEELPMSPYNHALHFKRRAPAKRGGKSTPPNLIETNVDKVKVSRIITNDGGEDLDVLDLKTRINEIIAMIKTANL